MHVEKAVEILHDVMQLFDVNAGANNTLKVELALGYWEFDIVGFVKDRDEVIRERRISSSELSQAIREVLDVLGNQKKEEVNE